jgi:hypothetical protein
MSDTHPAPIIIPVAHWPIVVAAFSTSLLVMVQGLQFVLVV